MSNRLSLPMILLQNFIFCTVIALVLWTLIPSVGQYGFFNNFVHAQAIGNSICLLAVSVTWLAKKFSNFGQWPSLIYILLVTPVGVYVGMSLASWSLGLPIGPIDIIQDTNQLAITALTAVLASIAFSWHLSNREKLLKLELVATKERHRADNARLAMLQAQLEPHMLFNTLANLRALISTDTERATEMLDRLDSFLRETLRSSQTNDPSKTNTLQHEFKILDDYLSLMQIRLGKRLAFDLDLPSNCHQLQIPPLLLQPLVENAIRHGIEPQIDGGCIAVRAHDEGNYLTLTVTDTGVGMRADQVPSETDISRSKSNTTETEVLGFGLKNLRDRLHQSFGDGVKLLIDSAEANSAIQGTRIVIQIPRRAIGKPAVHGAQQ